MITRRAPRLAAGIALVVLVLAGCGDDGGGEEGGGRPTVDELVPALGEFGLDEQGEECLAEALIDSSVSDSALQAIIDADGLAQARGVSAADQADVQTALGEGIKCSISDEISVPEGPTTTSEPGEAPASEPTTTAAG